ncbi:MAG: hypothetical protein ACK5TD_00380, partial [bacterium]
MPRSRILEPINNSTALVAVDTGRTWIVRLLRNCADSVEATSGSFNARFTSALSRSITGRGVAAGASRPIHGLS